MSNVVSPRGPLPPRVYWRRRLVLCAVVVGLVLLIGRLFGGGDDTEPVADRGTPTAPNAPTASASPTSAPSTQPTPGANQRSLTPRQVARQAAAQARVAELSGPTGPLAPAAGPCAPSNVAVVPDVQNAHAFSDVPLRIGLSATGSQACTFDFSSDNVALRVTSGEDLIWETLHCSSALPDESVVVRPGWLSYVTVDWSGRRGSQGCGNGGFAQPGYYWAEAAAIGGEPARSQFELRTPPPKPSPTATAGEKPGEEAGGQPSAQPSAQSSEQSSEQSGAQPSAGPTPSAGAEDTQQPSASPTTEPSAGRNSAGHSRRSG